jgi:hypothetical protein
MAYQGLKGGKRQASNINKYKAEKTKASERTPFRGVTQAEAGTPF